MPNVNQNLKLVDRALLSDSIGKSSESSLISLIRKAALWSSVLAIAALSAACGSSGGDDDSDTSLPPPNQPPSAVITADQTIDEASSFSVDGSASNDSDGRITSYQWSIDPIDGVDIVIRGNDQAITQIEVGEILKNVTLSLNLSVTDNSGAQGNSSKAIVIREIHRELLPPDPGASSLTPVTGVDVDGDGVRDDIEHGIYELYPLDQEMRDVMNFGARALQMALVAGATSEGSTSAATEVSKWVSCMVEMRVRDDQRIDYATKEMSRIDVLTFNTPERVAAKIEFERSLDGLIFASIATQIQDCKIN